MEFTVRTDDIINTYWRLFIDWSKMYLITEATSAAEDSRSALPLQNFQSRKSNAGYLWLPITLANGNSQMKVTGAGPFVDVSHMTFYKADLLIFVSHASFFFFKVFFFGCGLLKVFTNVLQYGFCSMFRFWPQGMWDLSSLTRDPTHIPYIGRWSLNHWITREVPVLGFLFWETTRERRPLQTVSSTLREKMPLSGYILSLPQDTMILSLALCGPERHTSTRYFVFPMASLSGPQGNHFLPWPALSPDVCTSTWAQTCLWTHSLGVLCLESHPQLHEKAFYLWYQWGQHSYEQTLW